MDKSFQGLVLSLIVHALLVWLLVTAKAPAIVPSESPTEVTLIERDSRKGRKYILPKELVEKDDVFKKLKEEAEHLSLTTKRVKKQMIAQQADFTRNSRLNLPPATEDQYNPSKREARERGEEPGLNGPPQFKPAIGGGSGITEFIPGIEEGGFTALNTDQFTYYAFFSRINEQVRNRWVGMIRNYMASLSQEELQHLSRSDRQTVVEIVLSKSGEFLKAFLLSSSTVRPLDQAAIEGFRMAAPFLNPPQGLVESDGYIHLRYGFMLRFRPTFGPGSN